MSRVQRPVKPVWHRLIRGPCRKGDQNAQWGFEDLASLLLHDHISRFNHVNSTVRCTRKKQKHKIWPVRWAIARNTISLLHAEIVPPHLMNVFGMPQVAQELVEELQDHDSRGVGRDKVAPRRGKDTRERLVLRNGGTVNSP